MKDSTPLNIHIQYQSYRHRRDVDGTSVPGGPAARYSPLSNMQVQYQRKTTDSSLGWRGGIENKINSGRNPHKN